MKSKLKSVTLKKYFFSEPLAEIHTYSNVVIKDKKLYLPRDLKSSHKLPTMYESWIFKRTSHVKFKYFFRHIKEVPYFEKTLLIFDTWGTSSYYHLLIDHIIPLWITREWLKGKLSKNDKDFEYYRISKNHYPTEISSANDIFKHFLGKSFNERVHGKFETVVYGYLYSFRPYHGPKSESIFYPEYSGYLKEFRKKYVKVNEMDSDALILVPKRADRDFKYVNDFVSRHEKAFNFRYVDFSEMSIQEQIRICSSARVMFGSEGAAFANQVFFPDKSLMMPVSNQTKRLDFHSPLSEYLDFSFFPVMLDKSGQPVESETEILQTLRRFVATS